MPCENIQGSRIISARSSFRGVGVVDCGRGRTASFGRCRCVVDGMMNVVL